MAKPANFLTLRNQKICLPLDIHAISRLKELTSDKERPIAILLHTNPDGDSAGSSLGLYGYFKNDGHTRVQVISPDVLPHFLQWMPWSDSIVVASKESNLAETIIAESDVLFCLDFNGFSRVNSLESALSRSSGTKVLIDHHPNPSGEFDLIFSNPDTSSAAELLYKVLIALDGEDKVTKPIAECLYAGIITDTGSFSYGCIYPDTYIITSKLIALGVDGEKIQRKIYNTHTFSRMRLLGYSIGQKLELLEQGHAAFISLTQAELEQFEHQPGDTEGFVNYALKINGIKLAAIFIEKSGYVKISFRSSDEVDVNLFARQYFNGGGHKNASGGKYFGSLDDALIAFRNLANPFISQYL